MKTFNLDDVIESMLKAHKSRNGSKAAYKAHATRRMNSYVERRYIEIGAKPHQVVAAVKAAFTKRKV